MTLTLYKCTSENQRVDKSAYLGSGSSYIFSFKDESSAFEPSILISTNTNITDKNYAYIDTLGRYYYVTDITLVRAGLYRLKLHVDVLMTYRTQIKACSAVIKRQESDTNMYLDDPEFKVYNNKRIDCYTFSSPFTKSLEFILTVAGN
jgi:hypothetical protein